MSAHLAVMRSRARKMLDDTGQIVRPGEGRGPFNPDTGYYDDPPPVVVYTGPILVRPTERAARVVEAAGAVVSLSTYDVYLPPNVTVRKGDPIMVTASRADPSLIGRTFRVVDAPSDSWQLLRQVVAQAVS